MGRLLSCTGLLLEGARAPQRQPRLSSEPLPVALLKCSCCGGESVRTCKSEAARNRLPLPVPTFCLLVEQAMGTNLQNVSASAASFGSVAEAVDPLFWLAQTQCFFELNVYSDSIQFNGSATNSLLNGHENGPRNKQAEQEEEEGEGEEGKQEGSKFFPSDQIASPSCLNPPTTTTTTTTTTTNEPATTSGAIERTQNFHTNINFLNNCALQKSDRLFFFHFYLSELN